MFQALQPHRPQLQNQPQNPLHQQQIRHQTTLPNPSYQPPKLVYQPPRPTNLPKSQIEAMPPYQSPPFSHQYPSIHPQLVLLQQQSQRQYPVYDPAKCHPVFFTQSLRRPPFPFSDSGGTMANPVAFGYVAESKGTAKGTKL